MVTFSTYNIDYWSCAKHIQLFEGRDISQVFVFVSLPHFNSTTLKEKTYTTNRSSARIVIERVLGALFKQFGIMGHSCCFVVIIAIEQVAVWFCILHNMIARIRGYKSRKIFRRELAQRVEGNLKVEVECEVGANECRYTQSQLWRMTLDKLENTAKNNKHLRCLINHIGDTAGVVGSELAYESSLGKQ